MAEPGSAARKPSWARPLGDPLAWRAADKCLLVVGIVLPGVGLFALLGKLIPGWLYLPAELSGRTGEIVDRLTLMAAAVWIAIMIAGLILRRRSPESRILVVITVVAYSLTIAVFVCLSGAFHSPGWILFLGGAVLGFLLFGRALTLIGIAIFLVVFALLMIAGELGHLGDILVITHPPPPGGEPWTWWLVRMSVSTAVFGGLTLLLCAHIIALLRDREARLDRMSKTDALTGLFNRRHFMSLLARELSRARRYHAPLSVVMIDLDHFKKINDQHGHLAGDDVLVAVAGALEQSVRDTDVVARYGGEEFVLLLPSTDRDGASDLAERCRELVATTHVAPSGDPLSVTASMGIASFPDDIDEADLDRILAVADEALYSAKHAGRNRVELAERRPAS